jgi:hypothetical protein
MSKQLFMLAWFLYLLASIAAKSIVAYVVVRSQA